VAETRLEGTPGRKIPEHNFGKPVPG